MESPSSATKSLFKSDIESNSPERGITKSTVLKVALAVLAVVAIAVDIAKIGLLKAAFTWMLSNPLVSFGVIFGVCAAGVIIFMVLRYTSPEAQLERAQKRFDAAQTKYNEHVQQSGQFSSEAINASSAKSLAQQELNVKKLVCYHSKSPVPSPTSKQSSNEDVAKAIKELSEARDTYQNALKEFNTAISNDDDVLTKYSAFLKASHALDAAESALAQAIVTYAMYQEDQAGNGDFSRLLANWDNFKTSPEYAKRQSETKQARAQRDQLEAYQKNRPTFSVFSLFT